MEIERISSEEYGKIFSQPMHVYNSIHFNDTVRNKCEECICLLLHENKIQIGLIGGIRENSFFSPYSAPFGGFSFIENDLKLSFIITAVELLETYVSGLGLDKIACTLPPYFYNEILLTKTSFAFSHLKYDIKTDINYHFRISDLAKYDTGDVDRSTRNNLRRASQSGLTFRKTDDDADKCLVYNIIQKNKEVKNRPIHMTLDYIMNTSAIIDIDFFLVEVNNEAIASAIVYHVTPHIVQVVYWGNLSESSAYRPMNFLAYNLFRHYADKKIVDMGTASENGVPIFGLCDFKENIGCTPTLKYTFIKNLRD